MKKPVICLLMVILAALLIFLNSFDGNARESAKPATPGQEKTYNFKMATFLPPVAVEVRVYDEWIKKIAEQTNGKVKITVYPADTLIAQPDIIQGVKGKIAEIGHLSVDSGTDQPQLNTILTLPFMPLGDWSNAYNVWMKLLDKYPEMVDEWSDFKILFRIGKPGMQLHTKSPAYLPKDIKGLKLFASGSTSEVMNDIGASPIFLELPDWYSSLDRGLIKGMVMSFDGLYETGCYKFLKYHTVFPSYITQAQGLVFMNKDVWNSLPPQYQKVFDDLSVWAYERTGELNEALVNEKIKAMKAEGHNFIYLTKEQEQVWVEAAEKKNNAFLDELESNGLPAREIYKEALRLAAQ